MITQFHKRTALIPDACNYKWPFSNNTRVHFCTTRLHIAERVYILDFASGILFHLSIEKIRDQRQRQPWESTIKGIDLRIGGWHVWAHITYDEECGDAANARLIYASFGFVGVRSKTCVNRNVTRWKMRIVRARLEDTIRGG